MLQPHERLQAIADMLALREEFPKLDMPEGMIRQLVTPPRSPNAHPQSPHHGFAWYELDLNWYGIYTLRMLGLARDLKLPKKTTAGSVFQLSK